MTNESYIDPLELRSANVRHDTPPHSNTPIRSAWRPEMLMRRALLTDRKIEQYRKRGFYDPEYRRARKEFAEEASPAQRELCRN